jgi:hypothetical protein
VGKLVVDAGVVAAHAADADDSDAYCHR